MKSIDRDEVISRLEKSVAPHIGPGMPSDLRYELYVQVAFQILDSEYMNYPEDALLKVLMDYISTLEE